MITAMKTVALYVRDPAASRDFFVDKVGFEVRRDEDTGALGRWLEVAPKDAQTGFVLADAAKFDKLDRVASSADVTLAPDDIQATFEQLKANGVAVTEPSTQPGGTFVQFTDLDGHEFVTVG